MKLPLQRLLPSTTETYALAVLSIIFLLLVNAHDLLVRYGLIQSSQLIHNQLASGVNGGLSKLDTYNLTRSVVLFMLWAIVGIVAFSLVQALIRAIVHRQFERELSSDHYIHPSDFNKQTFWKAIAIHATISFALLLLSVVCLSLYIVRAIPYSSQYTRRFLLHPAFDTTPYLLAGLVLLVAASWLTYAVIRVTYRHHHFVRQ